MAATYWLADNDGNELAFGMEDGIAARNVALFLVGEGYDLPMTVYCDDRNVGSVIRDDHGHVLARFNY